MKRKDIINNIKELYKNKKSLKEFAKEKYIDSEGYANIFVKLNDNVYDEYSVDNMKRINSSLINYIENEAYYIPTEYPINIIVTENNNLDIDEFQSILKDYYYAKLTDKKDDLKKNSIISIVLLIIGIVLLSGYFILKQIPETKDLFNEIFSIAATFSIWESVDFFLINRSILKIEYLNIAQLALLNVRTKNDMK